MNQNKICSICNVDKSITEYYKSGKTTYRSMCKDCYNSQKNERRKNYVKSHKESVIQYNNDLNESIKPGAYKITNILNNEILWVGQSDKPYRRKLEHFNNTANHRSPIDEQIYLGNINKHNLLFEMIEYNDDKELRLLSET